MYEIYLENHIETPRTSSISYDYLSRPIRNFLVEIYISVLTDLKYVSVNTFLRTILWIPSMFWWSVGLKSRRHKNCRGLHVPFFWLSVGISLSIELNGLEERK